MPETTPHRPATATKILVITAALVVIIAGMRAAQSILVPFLLSAFIAIICVPPLFWLQRRGLPTGIALLLVILAMAAAGFLATLLIGSSVHDFSQSLPFYQDRLHEKTSGLLAWLGRFGIHISEDLLLEYVDPGAAMRLASKMLTGFGNVLSNAFLILLTVIFILLEASSLPAKLRTALDRPDSTLENFRQFMTTVNRYMVIKTWVSLATGLLIAGWLALLGVDYAPLWGLLAFLLNYVPNIGSIIAALPAVLLALVQLGTSQALLTAAGFAVVNIIIGNVVEPRFMGRGLGLSTLVVFLSLVFWGWILGPVGMLLSIPLTMTVKIALASREESRWLAIMLGSAAPAGDQKQDF